MNLKVLSGTDEPAMLALLRSEKESKDTDYYLDRGISFWGIYNWFSKGHNSAFGIFENDELIAQVALAELPFVIKNSERKNFLLTDFLVRSDYRKSFAAAKLFTRLHKHLPTRDIIYLAIENQPGFADGAVRAARKFGHESHWLPDSNLVTLFPNLELKNHSLQGQLVLTDQWDRIQDHLNKYVQTANTWMKWNRAIELQNSFRSVRLFEYSDPQNKVSGLLVDRGNLQALRWNGQNRLLTEKYRRSLIPKNRSFAVGDELPFLTACFVITDDNSKTLPKELVTNIFKIGYDENYFGINFRDLNLILPQSCDTLSFRRRIMGAIDSNIGILKNIIDSNKERLIVLESLYL